MRAVGLTAALATAGGGWGVAVVDGAVGGGDQVFGLRGQQSLGESDRSLLELAVPYSRGTGRRSRG